jgi:hypothetical protein
MILNDIEKAIEIITPIFTLITILFVAQQTKYLTQQTRHSSTTTIASLYKDIAIQMIEIDKLFIHDPDLRPYFYENKPIPDSASDISRYKIITLAETFLDFFDLIMVTKDITFQFHTEKNFNNHLNEWKIYICSVYKTSPVLRTLLGDHKDWWVKEITEICKADNESNR